VSAAKPTTVSAAKSTAVSAAAAMSTTTATAGRCNSRGKSDRCTDCSCDGDSADCFSNHGKSPRWDDTPDQTTLSART
jgi:hypothetical protein